MNSPSTRALGFKINPRMRTKMKKVRHHLSKGRSAVDIAMWESMPLSQVNLLIAEINSNPS